MTTDFRALCVELLDCLEKADWPHKRKHVFEQWVYIARKALAEPEEPTDEEIMELMPQQMRDDLAAAARALAGFDPDNIKAASVFRIILNRHVADHARAVLARWGTPNLAETRRSLGDAPVPVSERLPGAEDCDAEGRIWTGHLNDIDGDAVFSWELDRPSDCTWEGISTMVAWLPAHALPVPGEVTS